MNEDNIVDLNTAKTSTWDSDIISLQQEMNIAELLKEMQRLDVVLSNCKNDGDDDEPSDRQDDVQNAIDKTIYEDTRVLAITRYGRPLYNIAAKERLVKGLSPEDKALVEEYLTTQYGWRLEGYEWKLNGTLAPRQTLRCKDVIAKLRARGVTVVWEENNGRGLYNIINPTCSQCVWMHTPDEQKGGEVDFFQIISNSDEMDEDCADAERRLLAMMAGTRAQGPTIHLVPLLLELYGDQLAVGEEALPLMTEGGLYDWRFLLTAGPVYDPRVIEEAA